MGRIILIAIMLSSCTSFEQKLGIDDHLKCTPHDAVGCIGFYNNN